MAGRVKDSKFIRKVRIVHFQLTDDQQMLKSLIERFVQDYYADGQRNAYLSTPYGFGPENWALLGELGLIATAFDEADGGFSTDIKTLTVIFEALGRGVTTEPLIESAYEAGALFAATAPGTLKSGWIERLVSGKKRLALAHTEQRSRDNPAWVEVVAEQTDGGFSLSGSKSLVPGGVGADGYILSTKNIESKAGDISLFFIPGETPGLQARPFRLVDGRAAVRLDFENMIVPAGHLLKGGLDDLLSVQQRADIARCAETLGLMETMFAATLDHLRTRKQFGQPLGSFQALQHRMVDQYVAIDQLRSLIMRLTLLKADSDKELGKMIAGVRAFAAEAGIALGHEAIQLHGGMGVSEEVIVSTGHKRLMMLARYPYSAERAMDIYAGTGTA